MSAVLLRVVLLGGIVGAGGAACATPGTPAPQPEIQTAVPAAAAATPAPSATPTSPPAAETSAAPVAPAYIPKTQHDNTPYRFDMNQNGKRMTAAEFDAWMAARGIRVATGKPPESIATEAASATQTATAAATAIPAATSPASPVTACITSAPKDC